jgi:hypothetical protein
MVLKFGNAHCLCPNVWFTTLLLIIHTYFLPLDSQSIRKGSERLPVHEIYGRRMPFPSAPPWRALAYIRRYIKSTEYINYNIIFQFVEFARNLDLAQKFMSSFFRILRRTRFRFLFLPVVWSENQSFH